VENEAVPFRDHNQRLPPVRVKQDADQRLAVRRADRLRLTGAWSAATGVPGHIEIQEIAKESRDADIEPRGGNYPRFLSSLQVARKGEAASPARDREGR